jgi:hypothetical protein
MKKYAFVLLLLGSSLILTGTGELAANCVSPNGYEDNGDCDRSDIGSKACISGGSPECYIPPAME